MSTNAVLDLNLDSVKNNIISKMRIFGNNNFKGVEKNTISCAVCVESGLDYWSHNPMGNIENIRKK